MKHSISKNFKSIISRSRSSPSILHNFSHAAKLSHFCLNFQSIRHHSVTLSNDTTEESQFRITSEQKQLLDDNGYLLLKNFVPSKVALNLRSRMMELLTNFDPTETKSVFTTHRTDKQYKDTYFLNSGDKISYFWEENVFDETGKLNREKEYAINKVGHALHTIDPYFHSYVWGYLPQLTYDIGFKEPIPLQSMYICKQPGVGGEVGEHQDSTFLLTKPHSCYGLWLAIDSTNEENGCVWAIPGSHKITGLKNRFKRVNNEETVMERLIDDGTFSKEGGEPIPCDSGDLLILHGEIVHWSDANTSNIPRHALMVHFVDNTCDYQTDNWLQYPNGKSFPQFVKTDIDQQTDQRQVVLNASF